MNEQPCYCRACGTQLIQETEERGNYDFDTGKPILETRWKCPKIFWPWDYLVHECFDWEAVNYERHPHQ